MGPRLKFTVQLSLLTFATEAQNETKIEYCMPYGTQAEPLTLTPPRLGQTKIKAQWNKMLWNENGHITKRSDASIFVFFHFLFREAEEGTFVYAAAVGTCCISQRSGPAVGPYDAFGPTVSKPKANKKMPKSLRVLANCERACICVYLHNVYCKKI